MGLIVSASVMLAMSPAETGDDVISALRPILSYASYAALLILVPIAYFVRNQIYKKHWHADAVSPRGYFLGNVVFLGLIDLPAMLSAMSLFMGARPWPALLPWGLVVSVILLNWPSGRPMLPVEPRLGVAER